jgi:hypothetical protein
MAAVPAITVFFGEECIQKVREVCTATVNAGR